MRDDLLSVSWMNRQEGILPAVSPSDGAAVWAPTMRRWVTEDFKRAFWSAACSKTVANKGIMEALGLLPELLPFPDGYPIYGWHFHIWWREEFLILQIGLAAWPVTLPIMNANTVRAPRWFDRKLIPMVDVLEVMGS